MRESRKGILQMILSMSLILLLAFIFETINITLPFYIGLPLLLISFIITIKGAIKFVSYVGSEESE